MEKCNKCGMPMSDNQKCKCEESVCVFCCSCKDDCQCKCKEKAAEIKKQEK